jgi:hypothetical protein
MKDLPITINQLRFCLSAAAIKLEFPDLKQPSVKDLENTCKGMDGDFHLGLIEVINSFERLALAAAKAKRT